MTSQHNTGTHPFYIGMYIHICTHIYVHIYIYIYFSEGMFMYFLGGMTIPNIGSLDPDTHDFVSLCCLPSCFFFGYIIMYCFSHGATSLGGMAVPFLV